MQKLVKLEFKAVFIGIHVHISIQQVVLLQILSFHTVFVALGKKQRGFFVPFY